MSISQDTFNLKTPIAIFVMSRLFILIVIQVGLLLFPLAPDPRIRDPFPTGSFLNGLVRWDGGWYVSIAERGYLISPLYKSQTNLAFMPLYPWVIHVTNKLVNNYFLTGILISNLSFLASLMFLFNFLRQRYGHLVAQKGLTLLSFSPFSFYFSTVYPESLFLLTITGTFYFSNKNKWLTAAFFAAASGLTREMGLWVAFVSLLFYFRSITFNLRQVNNNILKIALGFTGVLVYFTYLTWKFGDPLISVKSHLAPGWLPDFGLGILIDSVKTLATANTSLTVPTAVTYLFHLGYGLAALAIVLIGFKYLKREEWWWSLATVFHTFANWRVMGRLLIVVFPLFVVITLATKQNLYRVVLLGFALLSVFFTLMFSHGYWVA